MTSPPCGRLDRVRRGAGADPAHPPPRRPHAATKPAAKPAPRKPAAPTPRPRRRSGAGGGANRIAGHEPDPAYGAFQRGYYLTAFSLATQRVDEKKDVKAMTLLGELYANGLGVDARRQEGRRMVPARRRPRRPRGDVRARDVPPQRARRRRQSRARAPSCSPPPPSSAMPPPPTISACSISRARLFPQDFARAAELFRSAAQAGNPEAQYALATLYKEGRGVPRIWHEAARLLAAAAPPTTPTPRSNTPSRCSMAPASPRTSGRRRPVGKGGAQGQPDRAEPARQYSRGRPRRAGRSGRGDQMAPHRQGRRRRATSRSTTSCSKQTPEVRAAGEKAAKPWLDAIKEQRESRS